MPSTPQPCRCQLSPALLAGGEFLGCDSRSPGVLFPLLPHPLWPVPCWRRAGLAGQAELALEAPHFHGELLQRSERSGLGAVGDAGMTLLPFVPRTHSRRASLAGTAPSQFLPPKQSCCIFGIGFGELWSLSQGASVGILPAGPLEMGKQSKLLELRVMEIKEHLRSS